MGKPDAASYPGCQGSMVETEQPIGPHRLLAAGGDRGSRTGGLTGNLDKKPLEPGLATWKRPRAALRRRRACTHTAVHGSTICASKDWKQQPRTREDRPSARLGAGRHCQQRDIAVAASRCQVGREVAKARPARCNLCRGQGADTRTCLCMACLRMHTNFSFLLFNEG